MIHPTSNYLGYNRTNAISENVAQKNAAASNSSSNSDQSSAVSDKLSSSNTDALRTALNNTPEVRPDVVARGKALAADASYPPLEIINRLTEMIISSQDPSEKAS
ncbi:MAG TPA: hypothetical protein VIM69_12255 [Opitutaceae bacterium]